MFRVALWVTLAPHIFRVWEAETSKGVYSQGATGAAVPEKTCFKDSWCHPGRALFNEGGGAINTGFHHPACG